MKKLLVLLSTILFSLNCYSYENDTVLFSHVHLQLKDIIISQNSYIVRVIKWTTEYNNSEQNKNYNFNENRFHRYGLRIVYHF